MLRFGGGDAGEVLGHVVADAAAERVVIFTSRVLQVVVTLVVEHLVRGQVHRSIEQLGNAVENYSGITPFIVQVTYSEAREKPAQATEDESLDEADDVEQLPAFHVDAVDGEEDGDRAVDRHGQREHKEPSTIPLKMISTQSNL